MTPTKRVLEAIEEIKKGRMVIMIDDEDRENEAIWYMLLLFLLLKMFILMRK